MINRSLIRIKTIQILYSYLLTRNEFTLATAPHAEDTDRDHLFAYSVYLNYLVLLLKLSSQPIGINAGTPLSADPVLEKNNLGKALRSDSSLTALLRQHADILSQCDSVLPELHQAISQSAIYNDYKRKRKLTAKDNVEFWSVVFTTIVHRDKALERILRRDESFSRVGHEAGLRMFIDTLQTFDDTRATLIKARKDLDTSLSMAYNLYHGLLRLPILLTDLQKQRLEDAKNKYLPSADDLNPNLRFINNMFVEALRNCGQLNDYINENPEADPSQWRDIDITANALLDRILASEQYAKYMESESGDFVTDATFWREIMRTILLPSDELADCLETRSVYWNDDMPIMGTFVLKTIRRSYSGCENDKSSAGPGRIDLLPKFMNSDDEAFGPQLFNYVIDNRLLYRSYIDRFIDTKQWDTERLAFMDIVVMLTAIAEIINFPSIPIPVTMNEYIEIANSYSTQRSGQFVNGILFSVTKMLSEEGIINKKID